MKKKIGIVTFHNAPNYGAVLQAYALQKKLQLLGYEVFFIDNDINKQPSLWRLKSWLSSTPAKIVNKFLMNVRGLYFKRFRERYLILDKQEYQGVEYLMAHPPQADVYICGSDQIWNYNWINAKREHVFWLNFGGDQIKRIAYAASFGVSSIPDEMKLRYSGYVKRFNAISVREKNSINWIKEFGKDAIHVFDPTLLLNDIDYGKLIPNSQQGEKNYCFSYQVNDVTKDIFDQIKNHLTIRYSKKIHDSTVSNLLTVMYGPSKWLLEISNADFVITNSFHGLIFSLIFKKRFIVVLLNGKQEGMNSRIFSLLEQFNLEERAVFHYDATVLDELYNKAIDWESVGDIIDKGRQKAVDFLINSIGSK